MSTTRFSTILISFAISACTATGGGSTDHDSSDTQSAAGSGRVAGALLSQTEARRRSNSIDQLSYRLEIALEQSERHFSGQVAIAFRYRPNGLPLTIDFSAGEVHSLQINGGDHLFDYGGHFIELPATALQALRYRLLVPLLIAWLPGIEYR